jgi:hypothetical protein
MPHRIEWRVCAAVTVFAAGAALLAACGGGSAGTAKHATADVSPAGDIPDTQAFVSYVSPDGGYSLRVPEGWSRATSGGAIVFTDKLNTVRVDISHVAAAPTAASVPATDVPALRSQNAGFKLGAVTTVNRPAGTAVLITYQADSPPDPVTGKTHTLGVERYEFWQNGIQATITLSAPKGSDNVDPWKTITDSFGWHS